jgi:integrase
MSLPEGKLPDGLTKIVSPFSGKVTFEAMAGVINKKKIRARFGEDRYGSVPDALAAAKNWLGDKRAEIRRDRSAVINIPDKVRFQVIEALDRLKPHGLTLLQAVDIALAYQKRNGPGEKVTLNYAIKEFLAAKLRQGRAIRYVNHVEILFNAFAKEYGNQQISSITPDQIEEFLEKRNMAAVSWNNWRRDLRTLFNFAAEERRRWVAVNPAAQVDRKTVNLDEVKILIVEEVKKVLKAVAAQEVKTKNQNGEAAIGRQVPWMVLGLFGGLRRDEADAARWEHINWEANSLEVQSVKKRGARNRHIHMEPVLRAWLEKYKPENPSGPIGTLKFARRNDLRELSEKTGLDLLDNVYRHSFGSHHLWAYSDKQKTMLEMGHTNATTFDGYYNRPMPKIVALAYWDLMPEKVLAD